ncbi:MAG: hypothetical protein MUF31_07680, partial [Akkermansiaceae bacterium]|nr:hypothetical protein [Akkermansiaceae bacterium]
MAFAEPRIGRGTKRQGFGTAKQELCPHHRLHRHSRKPSTRLYSSPAQASAGSTDGQIVVELGNIEIEEGVIRLFVVHQLDPIAAPFHAPAELHHIGEGRDP